MCINSHIMIKKIRGSYWRCVLSEEEERPSMKKREYSGGIFIKNRNGVFYFFKRSSIIKMNESG